MAEAPPLDLPEQPRLAQNILHFARALRKAGMAVGPSASLDAMRAVQTVGVGARRDFYWALHACFVKRPADQEVFAQVFRLFWRDPRFLDHMMSLMLPSVRGTQPERKAAPGARRAAEGLTADRPAPQRPAEEALTLDASRTMSAQERLRHMDFEQMSAAEMAEAKRLLAQLRLPAPPLPARRFRPGPGATPDPRRTLRRMMRSGGELHRIDTRHRPPRPPNLAVLCDISGSMSAYARAVLQFVHAVSARPGDGWAAVHGFAFGTRLTPLSRALAIKDVDAALAAAGAEAPDWDGGTRIGAALRAFNTRWSRRVLGPGAVVLLITDGLERADHSALASEAERLSLSCRHLVWVNPLLRYDGFAPKAGGVRALLPHMHSVVPGHNIASLAGLAQALANSDDPGHKDRLMAQMRPGAAED